MRLCAAMAVPLPSSASDAQSARSTSCAGAAVDLLATQSWYGRCEPALAAAHLNAPLLGVEGGGGMQPEWPVVAAEASGGQQNGNHGSQTATHS